MTDTPSEYTCPRADCDWTASTERGLQQHIDVRHGPELPSEDATPRQSWTDDVALGRSHG